VVGVSVTPLAFTDYLRPVDGVGLAFLALFLGTVAFLVLAAQSATAT